VPEKVPVPTVLDLKSNSEPEPENVVSLPLAVPASALTQVLPTVAPPHDSPFSKIATVTVAPVEDVPCQMPSAVLTDAAPPPPPHAVSKVNETAEMASLKFDVILTPLVFIKRSALEHAVKYISTKNYFKTINFYC
jgi:hypothetical protein